MTKEYGTHEVDGELDINNAKIKVTIYLDGDVVIKARELAKVQGTKYQSLINSVLRESLLREKTVAKRLENLESRVEILESNG